MAQIRDTESQRTFPLRSHHTIGRCAERSDTIVSSPITSRIHLSVEWDGERWNARDLSKNGTWLGDSRLYANESVPLNLGDRLHLGGPDMPPLELVDDTPPRSTLAAMNTATTELALEPYVFLPSQENPEAVLIYSYHRHSWLLHAMDHDHTQAAERVIHHGDTLRYGDYEWQMFLVETGQTTELRHIPQNSLEDIEFVFDLSQDEENTALQMKCGQIDLDLGERSHHYLLLHLARLRATHAAAGLDQKIQGWIDNEQLKKDLGLDMPHINIMIFRARKQISESLANNLDSEQLIERGKGRMRFGGPRFKIYKGDQLSHALPPSDSSPQ